MSDNLGVTMDKFLSFWSQHTTVIIEALFAVVILFSLFLAYRSFFGNKSKEHGGGDAGAGQNLDTAQLEKTLQKILENQSHGGTARGAGAMEDLSSHGSLDGLDDGESAGTSGVDSEKAAVEISHLKASLSDSAKKIEILQAQLLEAQQSTSESAGASSAPAADGGGNNNDELNAKLRDLEARLSEYEIISEDIADLSRYREENEDLKKQLDALKASTVPVAAAAASAPAAPAPTPPVAAAVVESAPEPEPEPEPLAATPEPMVVAEAPAAPTAEETAAADLIDDELMKEFAAAVEGQKGLDKAAKKAGDGTAEPAKTGDDTDKLMDQFENFVTKKS